MQIKNFTEVKSLLEKYPTSSLFFFQDADEVTGIQLLSALMRIPGITREEAISAHRSIKPIQHRVSAGDIKSFLSVFTLMQRKAILFALEMNMNLEEVVLLKWKKALSLKLTETARATLLSIPRHLFIDFAFWEYARDTRATPLMTLIADFKANSAMSWEQIVEIYSTAIMMDEESDMHELELILSTLS